MSAFYHEIHNLYEPEDNHALLYDSIQVELQPENLDSLVYSEVTCSPTASLDKGIEAMLHHWLTQLRYQRPDYENIEIKKSEGSATVSCITIGKGIACTFTFVIHQHPDFVAPQDEPSGLTLEQTEHMLNTMDATFDGSAEDMLAKIKPARPASDNDSRGK